MTAQLHDRVALVTGAAQGLGFAIAQGIGAAGARLALADIKDDELEQAAKELAKSGVDAVPFQVDLADADAALRLPGQVADRFGSLDILVNNAGVRCIAPFLEYPADKWRQTLDVNLTAPFLLAQAAIPLMLNSGKGKIVNIASVAGELAFRDRAAYNAAKAGLIMLTKTIALELGGRGIYCNAVGPGIIETPLTKQYFEDQDLRTKILDNTPMGRWGTPEDVAGPVVFLCGDASDYVNGTTLFVDGAWTTGKGY